MHVTPSTLTTVFEGAYRRTVRASDRVIFGLATRRRRRIDARTHTLQQRLLWFRDELLRRAVAAGGHDSRDLEFAVSDTTRRLTLLAATLCAGTGAESNASRVIEATLERAAIDYETAPDAEAVAEALVAAADDVHDYLLSHDLVQAAGRRPVLIMRTRAVTRRVVTAWTEDARVVVDREPELVVSGSQVRRAFGDDLQLA
jgi:hypothetical protein